MNKNVIKAGRMGRLRHPTLLRLPSARRQRRPVTWLSNKTRMIHRALIEKLLMILGSKVSYQLEPDCLGISLRWKLSSLLKACSLAANCGNFVVCVF